MKKDIYEMITNKIIEKLEQGVVPWRKPFNTAVAVNWKTQKPYRGINVLLLDAGEYATFKQIKEAGGKVKKGEKGQIVVFWTFLEKENDEGKIERIPFLRYYTVFEINKQVEGLRSKRKTVEYTPKETIENAESLIKNYPNAPHIRFKNDGAYYIPIRDTVSMPKIHEFINSESYYSTFFHELVHSTGHEKRLNRDGIANIQAFGSESYSKEELVAEIGAAFLCGVTGINTEGLFENTTAYLQSWLRALKDDKKLIVTAAGQAQKAADHILNLKFEEEKATEKVA